MSSPTSNYTEVVPVIETAGARLLRANEAVYGRVKEMGEAARLARR